MSTRCNIIVNDDRGNKLYLYHHHDGYPEGVGSDLAHFVADRNIPYFYGGAYGFANRLLKGINSPFYEKVDNEYELTSALHGDIEYVYVVRFSYDDEAGRTTATLEAYKVLWSDEYAEYAETLTAIDGTIVAPISITDNSNAEEVTE